MKTKIFLLFLVFFTNFANNVYANNKSLLSNDDTQIYQQALKEAKQKKFEQSLKTASNAKNNILIPYFKWLELLENKTDFKELSEFIYFNPLFPRLHQIRKNAETAISDDISLDKVLKFFSDFPPLATEGKMIYASILQENNQEDDALKLVKETWFSNSSILSYYVKLQY